MRRETMADLVAFLAVARERSFTRAAAKNRGFALRAQPYHPQAGGATRSSAANAHQPQRLDDRTGRTAA